MITESRLQQQCFLWHWNTYPEDRGALYLHYNNPKNAVHGAILKGMGLVEGVSDLGYLRPDGRVTYIEMKLPGKKQSPAQKKWQQVVESRCGRYFVCDNLDDFQTIIKTEMQCENNAPNAKK